MQAMVNDLLRRKGDKCLGNNMSDPLPFDADIEDLIRQMFVQGLTARNRDGYLMPFMQTPEGVFALALESGDAARVAAVNWVLQSDNVEAYALITYDGQVTIDGTTTAAIIVEYYAKLSSQREVFACRYRTPPDEDRQDGTPRIEPFSGVVRLAT